MDKAKLAKLLAMTTSSNDNEALAAIRMANKMLSGEKLTWGDILAEGGPQIRVTIHQHRYPADVYKAAEAWSRPPKRRI